MRLLIPRFSLRAFLLVITALCCVLAYCANWIHQGSTWIHKRREFLAEQLEKRRSDPMLSGHWSHVTSQNNVTAPSSGAYREQSRQLYLLGEKGYHHIAIVIPESDTVKRRLGVGIDTLDTLDIQPDHLRAARLFPEASIWPFVLSANGAIEVNVKSDQTGAVIAGTGYWGDDIWNEAMQKDLDALRTRLQRQTSSASQ